MPRSRPQQYGIANKRQVLIFTYCCQLTLRVNNMISIVLNTGSSYRDSTTSRNYVRYCLYIRLFFLAFLARKILLLSAARITLLITTAPRVCRCDANVPVDGTSGVQFSVEDHNNMYSTFYMFLFSSSDGESAIKHQSSIINTA